GKSKGLPPRAGPSGKPFVGQAALPVQDRQGCLSLSLSRTGKAACPTNQTSFAFALAGAGALGGILAVGPRPLQLLILRRLQQAARLAGFPAEDLVRLAMLLAALLPLLGPAVIGGSRLALLLVPEQGKPLAVAVDAQRHGG